jgi:hypothetical protein
MSLWPTGPLKIGELITLAFSSRHNLANHWPTNEVRQMKKLLCAFVLVGFVSSCGIGNSLGGSSGSSTGSSGSASSAGSGSSAGSFGLGRRQANKQLDPLATSDGRTLIAVIKEARFERTRDGGIVYARGISSRQGYYKALLTSPTNFAPDEKGVLTLEFRAKEPQFQTLTSTEHSREIDVGLFISKQKLEAAKSIRIVGRQNQIVIRRK